MHVVPPRYAAVCKAWRELALSLPTIALRIDNRQRISAEEILDAAGWSSIFRRCASAKAARRGARIDRLQRAATARRPAARRAAPAAVARKLPLDQPRNPLPGAPVLAARLLLCGVNGEPARALAESQAVEAMRGLRVLGLHDCDCPATDVMPLLPRLPALAALLVGAGILTDSLAEGAVQQRWSTPRPSSWLPRRPRGCADTGTPGGDRGDARVRSPRSCSSITAPRPPRRSTSAHRRQPSAASPRSPRSTARSTRRSRAARSSSPSARRSAAATAAAPRRSTRRPSPATRPRRSCCSTSARRRA